MNEICISSLKKEKALMKKWKMNKRYVVGYADFLNGRGKDMELFELTDYKAKYTAYDADDIDDEEDDKGYWDVELQFKNVVTRETHWIDQDDRYGKFALVDNKIEELESYFAEYSRKAKYIERFLKDINDPR